MGRVRVVIAAFFSGIIAVIPVAQTVPATINYQGRLTDNTPAQNPVSATVNMTFEIWDVPSGGTAGTDRLWIEPASGTTPVPVTGGIFSVLLGASAGGSSVPIPASVFSGGTARYLQLIVNGETLTPRQSISAAGYANQAQNAANATNAATATNATQLNSVAASGYQLATVKICAAGTFLNTIAQNGTTGCASAQTSITPPLALSGTLATPVISGTNAGTGDGIYGENSSSVGTVFGVHGKISSTTTSGVATGVRGENLATNTGYGVWGSTAGNGYGVYGTAAGGYGVYGDASAGYGVYGRSNTGFGGIFVTSSDTADALFARTFGMGPALRVFAGSTASPAVQIEQGMIKVTGASLASEASTPTKPVFIITATAGNIIPGGGLRIDHPLTDGDPNAILIVTPNYNPHGTGGVYEPHPIGVYYTGSKWAIFNQDAAAMPVGAAFNVLVVKP